VYSLIARDEQKFSRQRSQQKTFRVRKTFQKRMLIKFLEMDLQVYIMDAAARDE